MFTNAAHETFHLLQPRNGVHHLPCLTLLVDQPFEKIVDYRNRRAGRKYGVEVGPNALEGFWQAWFFFDCVNGEVDGAMPASARRSGIPLLIRTIPPF